MTFSARDHTFVICAYGESPYLEACIRSLRTQTVRSRIVMATSTPNETLRRTAKDYDIKLYVNQYPENGIAADWDYALRCADTSLVTLAHQDDVYLPLYTERMLAAVNAAASPILFSCGYGELRRGETVVANRLLNIKKILRIPMRLMPGVRAARRLSLAFGDPICCPSVTYVRERMADFRFSRELRCDLDWDAWERLSREKGSFVFSPEVLMLHRIHDDSETSRILGENARRAEDYQMFRRFWPEGAARRLADLYAASEKSNRL
ncbi:MAG: glycosyltransferase family 2 protein [Oscillospiraceae bacterium]|nr:glycosyltransferase family 2 protein [Oscillospiraceae bacterium]